MASAMHKGRQWRRLIRIERAARLTVTGLYSDAEIANQIGITQAAFSTLKTLPEFKARMIEVATGVTSQHDLDIREDIEFQRAELAAAVPMAIQRLKTLVLSRNESVALKAAGDLLDRQGDHARVSRSEIKLEEKYEHSKHDALATDILEMLRTGAATIVEPPKDSEAVAEFSRGAADAEKQLIITSDSVNEDTLKYIDEKKLPVQ